MAPGRQGTCRLDAHFNATANSTALDGGLVIGYLRASSEHQCTWKIPNKSKEHGLGRLGFNMF